MAQLQPFVSNVPLQVAKNLRFNNANNIPVTEMLPVGMNGIVVNDSPTTGYISRIGAVLSNQIDLYNQVTQTLATYGQDIASLDSRVDALEISGNTVPNVNGHCFTGDALSPITTVVELMAESACDYNTVLGTTSALMEAILAEGASTLNVLAAFSQASAMAGLSGWISDPKTIADTINNLWLSYLDSRAGVANAISQMTPACSQAIVNFYTRFSLGSGSTSGIAVYFSGYSFIPTAYVDNGSTITITDGIGGIYTTGVDLIARSQPGADRLFVGISGTSLAVVPSYTVTLDSKIKSSYNTCTKVVVHTTTETPCGDCSSGSTAPIYQTGTSSDVTIDPTGYTIPTTLPSVSFADIVPIDGTTASALAQGYFISFNGTTAIVKSTGPTIPNMNFKWVAYA